MGGKTDDMKSRVKEAVGAMTGDDKCAIKARPIRAKYRREGHRQGEK